MEFLAVKPCRFDAFEAVPKGRVSLDLEKAEATLSRKGYEIVSNPKVLLVLKKGIEITLYPHGRVLMSPVSSREQAEKIAKELYSALGR